jgi:hypothetical protein
MPKLKLTESSIKKIFDKSEEALSRAWSIIHGQSNQDAESILSLQPLLVEILTEIEAAYRQIVQSERDLIRRKKQLNAEWFKRRMQRLARYRKAIMSLLGTARSIGDGFAWIFYRNDQDLVDKHLALQQQRLLPPGIGGRGERIFLKQFQSSTGTLAIYHGLTTFLRMGDFSFYDPKASRIVAIGELKTDEVNKTTHDLYLSTIGVQDSDFSQTLSKLPRKEVPSTMSQKRARRLKRQVDQIRTAFRAMHAGAEEPQISSTRRIDFTNVQRVLENASPHRIRHELIGKGLLVLSLQLTGSMYERELGKRKFDATKVLDGVPHAALKIMNAGANDNSLTMSPIGFSSDGNQPAMMPGSAPIFWWPVKERHRKDFIFGRTLLIGLYNPSFLIARLKERGFQLGLDERYWVKRAFRRLDDGRSVTLQNISFFQKMACSHFLDEDSIEIMIDVMEQQALSERRKGNVKVELKPRLRFI